MTNLQVFLECVIHTTHRLYGYRLRPLSLYHLAMLEQYAPSVLSGECREQDLKLAACICASKDADDFRRKSKSIRVWLTNFYRFETQVTKFADYIADYLTFPEVSQTKDKTNNNPFPTALIFAAKLIKETGYDFDRVFFAMPVSQIYWLVMSLGYLERGETMVVSDLEREIYRMIEAEGKVTG